MECLTASSELHVAISDFSRAAAWVSSRSIDRNQVLLVGAFVETFAFESPSGFSILATQHLD